MAARWAPRPAREDSFCARARWRRPWSVEASWRKSASFSGLGGMGGGRRLSSAEEDGRAREKGSSIKSGGGGGFGLGCIGGCCQFCRGGPAGGPW